tara:strand:- start:2564 stop:2872 length:309 start_codon:yes stop_codon:yes gene_type:complete
MNMLQLNPPIPVETPLGEGWAQLVIDYSPDFNTIWVVFLTDSGMVKHFDSNDLRVCGNETFGIPYHEKPKTNPRPWSKKMKDNKECDCDKTKGEQCPICCPK